MNSELTNYYFTQTFELYNLSVFPIQVFIVILGVVVSVVPLANSPENTFRSIFIGGCLALLWMWIGVAYFLTQLSRVFPIAYLFGVLFVLQGLLFLLSTMSGRLQFTSFSGWSGWLGYSFVAYGVLVYPLVSYFSGASLEGLGALGLPSPSTIEVFGLLIIADQKYPRYLLLVPLLWAVIGVLLAIRFSLYQDFLLLPAALAAVAIRYSRGIARKSASNPWSGVWKRS